MVSTGAGTNSIVKIRDLSVKYGSLYALKKVSLDIRSGEKLGVLGQSGSGKTTLCKVIAGVEKEYQGEILWMSEKKDIQFIFQDPASSLNPRMRIFDIVVEPLIIRGFKKNIRDVFERVMFEVGLNPQLGLKYPHQISGGQRQRVAIARALTTKSKLLICDEPVSGVDISLAAQILNLLYDLQKKYAFGMIFVSHDISFVYYLTERSVVLLNGEVVEYGFTSSIIKKPIHPYTRLLISSILCVGEKKKVYSSLKLTNNKSFCPFSLRCPNVSEICNSYDGRLFMVEDEHYVSCVRYKDL